MKLMNSETHSWTHSLASFEILAVAGTLDFIILATFAILQTRQSQVWVEKEAEAEGNESSHSPARNDLVLCTLRLPVPL